MVLQLSLPRLGTVSVPKRWAGTEKSETCLIKQCFNCVRLQDEERQGGRWEACKAVLFSFLSRAVTAMAEGRESLEPPREPRRRDSGLT